MPATLDGLRRRLAGHLASKRVPAQSVVAQREGAVSAAQVLLQAAQQDLITWDPTPGFRAFVVDDWRWVLLRAANQVGKTMAAAWVVCDAMIHSPGLRCRAYAPNREMGRQVIQRYVYRFLRDHLVGVSYAEGRGFSRNTITLKNGSILQFRSYEDHPQAGAGDQLDIVWLDEVPKEGHYREAIARVTRRQGRVIVTCTPVDRPVAWFRDIVEPPNEETLTRAVWIAGHERPQGAQWKQYVVAFERENVPWLTEEAYQQQVDLVSSDPTQAAQRLGGAWEGLTVDRLFTGYSTACQLSLQGLEQWRWALGIDHGELAGNQVALLVAWRGRRLHVVAEYVDDAALSYEEDAAKILRLLAEHGVGPHQIGPAVGDTNLTKGGLRVNEVLEGGFRSALGVTRTPIRIEGADKSAGSVDFGVRVINYALKRGDLTVDPRCTYLIACLAGYKGSDVGEDKQLSHGAAALRYIAARLLAENPVYRQLRFR